MSKFVSDKQVRQPVQYDFYLVYVIPYALDVVFQRNCHSFFEAILCGLCNVNSTDFFLSAWQLMLLVKLIAIVGRND